MRSQSRRRRLARTIRFGALKSSFSVHFRRTTSPRGSFFTRCLLSDPIAKAQHKKKAKFDDEIDTLVYPTLQYGALGCHFDSFVMRELMTSLADFENPPKVALSSAYLNLTRDFASSLYSVGREVTISTFLHCRLPIPIVFCSRSS